MATVITMPKMSDTMKEGVIAKWLKKVGDVVKPGDILAEVETDKATMELENYETGTILYIAVADKGSVPVDGIIAIVGKPGEDYQALLGGGTAPAPVAAAPTASAPVAPQAVAVDTSNIKATVITMPKMSDTMKEGVIDRWLKKVGDKVKPGDILAEVQTDKATMELENYEAGTILYIAVADKGSVPVDGIIAIVGEEGTDYTPLLNQSGSKAAAPAKTEATPAPTSTPVATPAQPTTPAATSGTSGRVFASPLAKKMASDKGINISEVQGSGENGRVIKKDIETYQPKQAAAPAKSTSTVAVGVESYTEEPVSQMRKVIAQRLSESKFTAPHFYLTMEINMDKAIEARKSLNEVSPVKISFNDMVIKATAVALKQNPKVNSSWLGDKIRYNQHVHIGMAVAVEDGLLVPVIRFADSKSLSQISTEAKDLSGKAKAKKLQPADWAGNTFTISNLGMFGIEQFTAIVNPPDACILAVGGIKEVPIVKNGQIVPGNLMKVTLSCDHRVVDGAVGSAFLVTLKSLLEDPIRLLV
jgi:pyruvate dehydrogenase E2 component (dihydrolipoamide acetyltransferase)